MMTRNGSESAWDTLAAYARVVRRRWWIVVLVGVLLPLLAIGFSRLQEPVYEASAKVLISRENLAATLGGVPDTLASSDPARFMQTQAGLARTSEVARRTLGASNPGGLTAGEFLQASSVRPEADSDLLVFSATAPEPGDAVSLANAYARSYTQYRNQLETAPLQRALASVTSRIDKLRISGQDDSSFFAALLDKQQQLRTIQALKTDSATLVQPAVGASKIQPQTAKRAQLALVFGVLLGLALAFLLEAADRRLRSPDDVSERLGLQTLGRIPRLAAGDRLPTLTQPGSFLAEAFRILRMNIEFAAADRQMRTVMVTSAMEGEGKTTTAANLAITMAKAGRSVILLDADYLQPSLASLFSVAARPGLVQVARREVQLASALTRIRMPDSVIDDRSPARLTTPPSHVSPLVPRLVGSDPSASQSEASGVLQLLATEKAPLESTEELLGGEFRRVLDQLEAEADLVIIDAPPLGTSVTLRLGSIVDGVLVVAKTELLRESTLDELARSLEELRGEKLGLVLTGVDQLPSRVYAYATERDEPTNTEQALVAASPGQRWS
jgi:non-specific protein-tyrosine kinase